MNLAVDVNKVEDDAILTVRGPVDLATVPALKEAFEAQAAVSGTVVVDLTAVTFLDSSGLRVLAQQHRHLTSEHDMTRLRLVVTNDPVGRLLEVSGLRTFFDVYDSVDEARRGR